MTLLIMRQYLVVSMMMAMVWIMAVTHPMIRPMSASSLSSFSFHKPWARAQMTSKLLVAKNNLPAAPLVQLVKPDFSGRLYLHSYLRDYSYVFTGKVMCGNKPCHTADVRVQVESLRNPDLVQNAVVQPDGSFYVAVSFKEMPQEQVDWRILAASPDSTYEEVHGRQILMDETTLTVEKSIRLL